jgi:uncharacterized protein YggE
LDPTNHLFEPALISRCAVVGTLGMAGVAGAGWGAARALASAMVTQDSSTSVTMAHSGTIRGVGLAPQPIQPEAAVVTIGVDLSAPALADAQAENAEAVDAILATLGELRAPNNTE